MSIERQIGSAPNSAMTIRSLMGRVLLGLAVALFVAFLTLPIIALLLRVPLSTLADYLTRPIVIDALLLSLYTSLLSLALMVLLGTPVAYLLARYSFPGKRLLETLDRNNACLASCRRRAGSFIGVREARAAGSRHRGCRAGDRLHYGSGGAGADLRSLPILRAWCACSFPERSRRA